MAAIGGADRQSPVGHFEDRVAGRIADQSVSQREGRPVSGPSAADAQVRVTGAAEVLDRNLLMTAQNQKLPHRATNRTRASGENSAGVSDSASHTGMSVWRMSCQPPGDSRG